MSFSISVDISPLFATMTRGLMAEAKVLTESLEFLEFVDILTRRFSSFELEEGEDHIFILLTS